MRCPDCTAHCVTTFRHRVRPASANAVTPVDTSGEGVKASRPKWAGEIAAERCTSARPLLTDACGCPRLGALLGSSRQVVDNAMEDFELSRSRGTGESALGTDDISWADGNWHALKCQPPELNCASSGSSSASLTWNHGAPNPKTTGTSISWTGARTNLRMMSAGGRIGDVTAFERQG